MKIYRNFEKVVNYNLQTKVGNGISRRYHNKRIQRNLWRFMSVFNSVYSIPQFMRGDYAQGGFSVFLGLVSAKLSHHAHKGMKDLRPEYLKILQRTKTFKSKWF